MSLFMQSNAVINVTSPRFTFQCEKPDNSINYIKSVLKLAWFSTDSVPKVISRLLWFCFTALCDFLPKFAAPVSQPMTSKTKTNRASLAQFSRAWRRLHVFASSYDE